MKTTPTRIHKTRLLATTFALAALATLNACLSTVHAQGSLTPTGAPGMTMKSLAQIEPRTDIMALGGDLNNLHIITSPGSYYLTTNLTLVASKNGISVQANNVTIDLNGFSVLGVPSSNNGIDLPNNQTNLVVRNGTITGTAFYGISADTAYYSTFENLTISKNLILGIDAGRYALVRNCFVVTNSGDGLYFKSHCTVENCTVSQNGGAGIHCKETLSHIEGNHLIENATGLLVDNASNLILHNDASGNGVNYSIVANNKVGVIVSVPFTASSISGSTGGTGMGTTDPWANFSF